MIVTTLFGMAPEVAPFGIRTMVVEPGFFRTELLTPDRAQPPLRFPAGADAVETFAIRAKHLRDQAAANCELSSHLGYEDA